MTTATTTTTATGQRVANDNGSDFCAAEQEEVRAFLLPLLLLLLAMPVREILLNKFFNDFYYTPVSQPASQSADQSLRQPLCRYTHASIQVCLCVCICASVYCIVYSGKRRKYYYAHKHSRTHARLTHDIASEERQAGRCTRAGNTTTSDALNRTWRIEICRGSTKLPEAE